jgi:hypothetical protein
VISSIFQTDPSAVFFRMWWRAVYASSIVVSNRGLVVVAGRRGIAVSNTLVQALSR